MHPKHSLYHIANNMNQLIKAMETFFMSNCILSFLAKVFYTFSQTLITHHIKFKSQYST